MKRVWKRFSALEVPDFLEAGVGEHINQQAEFLGVGCLWCRRTIIIYHEAPQDGSL